jgi:hypothetical protein
MKTLASLLQPVMQWTCLLGFTVGLPALAGAASIEASAVAIRQPVAVAPALSDQYLDAQQFRIDAVAGMHSEQSAARRTVLAWQISAGKWNGQLLDGLALVLVQTEPTDAAPAGDTAIYVSDVATPAQRDALLAAIGASHPAAFTSRDGTCRIAPAFIRVEQIGGGTLVLHLAPIA